MISTTSNIYIGNKIIFKSLLSNLNSTDIILIFSTEINQFWYKAKFEEYLPMKELTSNGLWCIYTNYCFTARASQSRIYKKYLQIQLTDKPQSHSQVMALVSFMKKNKHWFQTSGIKAISPFCQFSTCKTYTKAI